MIPLPRRILLRHKSLPASPKPVHTPSLPYTALKGRGKGRIAVLVAAGPSVSQVELVFRNPSIDIICINKPLPHLNPRYWAFYDESQHLRNKEYFQQYPGTVINGYAVKGRRSLPQVFLPQAGNPGFYEDGSIWVGKSSTYATMQAAAYMEYDHVWVFGCDMAEVEGKLWWYGSNPDASREYRKNRFREEAESYSLLSPTQASKFTICSQYNKWPQFQYFERISAQEGVNRLMSL